MVSDSQKLNQYKKLIKEIREVSITYPLLEFMRWKGVEGVLLTIFQTATDIFPGISLLFFFYNHDMSLVLNRTLIQLTAIAVGLIGFANYYYLKRGLFEKLIGPIQTPD